MRLTSRKSLWGRSPRRHAVLLWSEMQISIVPTGGEDDILSDCAPARSFMSVHAAAACHTWTALSRAWLPSMSSRDETPSCERHAHIAKAQLVVTALLVGDRVWQHDQQLLGKRLQYSNDGEKPRLPKSTRNRNECEKRQPRWPCLKIINKRSSMAKRTR